MLKAIFTHKQLKQLLYLGMNLFNIWVQLTRVHKAIPGHENLIPVHPIQELRRDCNESCKRKTRSATRRPTANGLGHPFSQQQSSLVCCLRQQVSSGTLFKKQIYKYFYSIVFLFCSFTFMRSDRIRRAGKCSRISRQLPMAESWLWTNQDYYRLELDAGGGTLPRTVKVPGCTAEREREWHVYQSRCWNDATRNVSGRGDDRKSVKKRRKFYITNPVYIAEKNLRKNTKYAKELVSVKGTGHVKIIQ